MGGGGGTRACARDGAAGVAVSAHVTFPLTVDGRAFTVRAAIDFGRRATREEPAEPTTARVLGIVDADGRPADLAALALLEESDAENFEIHLEREALERFFAEAA